MEINLKKLAQLSRAYLAAMSLGGPNPVPAEHNWFGAKDDLALLELIIETANADLGLSVDDLIGISGRNPHPDLHKVLCIMYFG